MFCSPETRAGIQDLGMCKMPFCYTVKLHRHYHWENQMGPLVSLSWNGTPVCGIKGLAIVSRWARAHGRLRSVEFPYGTFDSGSVIRRPWYAYSWTGPRGNVLGGGGCMGALEDACNQKLALFELTEFPHILRSSTLIPDSPAQTILMKHSKSEQSHSIAGATSLPNAGSVMGHWGVESFVTR